ncbi:hypothetical protein [Microbacterium schleiferi]|uniref:Uncharacterized protein n=1 Tax=Microbacterium schleiferi TaxID=69362 RepID=A0ABU7V4V0_9MICO
MTTLGALAAIIPILGSLWVASSFLAEQTHLRHERRVRDRVAVLKTEGERRWFYDMPKGNAREAILEDIDDFERRMLAYSGLGLTGLTWRDVGVRDAMTGAPVSSAELRRQWVLLLSAVTGLVLLAIEISTPLTP